MNTTKTLALYAAATLVMFIDFALMNYGFKYALQMLMLSALPILITAALMVLVCVLLWKKPMQLTNKDIFLFVVYNTATP